jgi:hypothetical protein
MPPAKKNERTAAAYTLVDLSDVDEKVRKDIIEDANAGGANYGVRVVEESVNGGARAPIYGVYDTGPDHDRWVEAKKDLKLSATEVGDDEVYTGAGGPEVSDPRREAALREAAAQRAEGEADRIRSGEIDAVQAITGDTDEDAAARRGRHAPGGTTGHDHTQNIVDDTLSEEATNEASEAQNQKTTKAASKTKTPR